MNIILHTLNKTPSFIITMCIFQPFFKNLIIETMVMNITSGERDPCADRH